MIGGDDASRPRHVFDDDRGIARNMLGEMPADQPRILVVAAAGGKPDDDPHGLAAVETSDRFFIESRSLTGIGRTRHQADQQRDYRPRHHCFHHFPPSERWLLF